MSCALRPVSDRATGTDRSQPTGPLVASALADGLKARGRCVRVRAVNLRMLPGWVAKQPDESLAVRR